MDWKEAIREEGTMLMRIVPLLLSLADLAEGSRKRSRAVRALICWLLRPLGPSIPPGDVYVEAEWLAMRFRALAHVLVAQMEYALLICGDDQQTDRPLLDRADRFVTEFMATFAGLSLALTAAWASPAPDTS